MKAEIIAIGNEIVFGHTVNTNASYIARALDALGVTPQYHTAVCDGEEVICEAMMTALRRADMIILTGGLGPTPDDLTKEAVCKALSLKLALIPNELERIKMYFEKQGKLMPANNKKQATFPKEAIILPNTCGTAPGCIIEQGEKCVILLPGPPKEMQAMFNKSVRPYIKKKVRSVSCYLDIHCFGIGEGALAMKIADLIGEYEWGSIATYVGDYEVTVRVSVHGEEEEKVAAILEEKRKSITACLEDYIVGYNEDKLEELVARALIEQQLKVATVESCTGGLVAGTLINYGGISASFNEGIVTYSNEAKMKYVGVNETTLKRVGAVSEETAQEMAEGIRRVAGSDIGLSTTGIAGPGGGTPEKPVGLVYIGIATAEGTDVYRLQLSGDRREVREKTVKHILFHLYQKIRKK